MRPQFFRETSQTQEKLEKNQTNKQTNKECVNFQNQMGFGNIQEDATKDQRKFHNKASEKTSKDPETAHESNQKSSHQGEKKNSKNQKQRDFWIWIKWKEEETL